MDTSQSIPALRTPRTVLVVDDEQDLADQIARHLKFLGFDADAVYDAAQAMARMESCDYRVVITDIQMPGLLGDDLIREIKKRDGTVQVFAMSGHVRMARLIHCLRIGATDCFAKPVSLQELATAVADAFARLERWVSIMKSFHGCPAGTVPSTEGELHDHAMGR